MTLLRCSTASVAVVWLKLSGRYPTLSVMFNSSDSYWKLLISSASIWLTILNLVLGYANDEKIDNWSLSWLNVPWSILTCKPVLADIVNKSLINIVA